jgi:uncharacterized protein YacL
MNHLIFILKTIGISLLISGIFGILSGFIWSMKSPEHAHQMFPNWMVTLVVAAVLALGVGIVVGGILSFSKKANLLNSLLYTNGIVFFLVIALVAYAIHNGA